MFGVRLERPAIRLARALEQDAADDLAVARDLVVALDAELKRMQESELRFHAKPP